MKTARRTIPNAARRERFVFSDDNFRLAIISSVSERVQSGAGLFRQSEIRVTRSVLHRLKVCGYLDREHYSGCPLPSRSPAGSSRLLICQVDRVDHQELFLALEFVDQRSQIRVLAECAEAKSHAWNRAQY